MEISGEPGWRGSGSAPSTPGRANSREDATTAEFSEYSGYTLTDLVKAQSWPWYRFAAWADKKLPAPYQGQTNPKLGRFIHGEHAGIYCGFGAPCPADWPDWAVLACNFLRDALHSIASRSYQLLALAVGFEWPARAGSRKDMKFEAYAREAILDHKETLYPLLRELVRWAKGRRPFDDKNWGWGKEPAFFPSEMFAKHGTSHQQLRWSRWVVRGPSNHERAFWNLVRNAIRDDLSEFRRIGAAISESRPLTEDQQGLLIYYQGLGTLRTIRWIHEDQSIRVETVMEADWDRMNASQHEMRASALLVPIAYQLAVAWERSQPWPRFVVTCRNPLCGRPFYSGHASAKTCPRPPGSGRRSDCKAVWEAYQKWLRKLGRDPEKHWADKKSAKAFCRQFKPRDAQSNFH